VHKISIEKKVSRIGVFDSGIGGLTVLKSLLELVPGVEMVYLGDCARLPYGTKSSKTIINYSIQCARFLATMDIDMLVIACNTASAHAIPALKDEFDIPVVGVVEAGSQAVVESGGNRIGVIGTPATIKSRAYEKAIQSLKPEVEIFVKPCPLFVPLVEEGWCDDPVTEQVAGRYLQDLIDSKVDTLLLGCTHYPLLKDVISRVMGRDVRIVDSALSTAKVVQEMIGPQGLEGNVREVAYYLSDISSRFIDLGEIFLGREMKYVYDVDLCV
jgi:glutamate racemase